MREHDYVLDVANRLRRELESHTGAKVFMTLDDPGKPSAPGSADELAWNKRRAVLTTPPFLAEEDGETAVAVNLRWYLANSVYPAARQERDRSRQDRVRLAPRGRAAYPRYGGDDLRAGCELPHRHDGLFVVHLPALQGSSRAAARQLHVAGASALGGGLPKARGRHRDGARKDDLPIQPYQPIRERVIRGREVWLPAVLRGNIVPAKVLVEMVNLNNDEDAAL